MISLKDLKNWLNHFDSSHLGHQSLDYLAQMEDTSTPPETRQIILEKLLAQARKSLKPFEFAEANFLAGVLLCEQVNDFKNAQIYFERALFEYKNDDHRRVVALWALGIVERANFEFNAGYCHWHDAREACEEIAQHLEQAGLAERLQLAPWYRARLEEMVVDIALTVEEGYTMLDVFEPSPLDEINRAMIRSAVSFINLQQRASAFAILNLVRERVQLADDYLESPAGYVECGLAIYQMGLQEEAVELLRRAIEKFPPLSHRQGVANWMAGCLWVGREIENPQRIIALDSLREALQNFDYQHRRAVAQNQKRKAAWYQAHLPLLRCAYDRLLHEWIPE